MFGNLFRREIEGFFLERTKVMKLFKLSTSCWLEPHAILGPDFIDAALLDQTTIVL